MCPEVIVNTIIVLYKRKGLWTMKKESGINNDNVLCAFRELEDIGKKTFISYLCYLEQYAKFGAVPLQDAETRDLTSHTG